MEIGATRVTQWT